MVDPDEVCVLIPTLDEAPTIGEVVDGFAAEGFGHVLVIDGGSTDGTVAIARDHGADVRTQSGSGKGSAVQEGVAAVDKPKVLLVDGDGTYRSEDARSLIAPLDDGSEHVIGDRFADLRPGAMTRLNRIGNRLINRVFAWIHGRDLRDILSGYRAFTTNSFERMRLSSEGFGIETEMAVECVRHDIDTEVVDITYQPRPAESDTNLRPFRDGAVILSTLWRLARTTNPLFYFGTLGVMGTMVAMLIGLFVGYEWVARGVSHHVLALISAFGILFGFQLVTFGVLTDMILRLRR